MLKFTSKINIDIFFYVILLIFFCLSLFLSVFRDAIRDETIYIHETFLLSELLRNGIWFGDYAVGLHGFLFKIPPAIVFIFTGSSVFILTLYNIILSCVACVFLYKFFKEAFHWRFNALLALGLIVANFHFILTIPTYLREMPSLLAVSLLLYGIHKNWRPWILGLVFLLLLDAKEYLFFIFVLGYFIAIGVKYFNKKDLKGFLLESVQIAFLPIVWIVLMFTTSLIPVNMFLASILGIVSTGTTHLVAHFSVDVATTNLLDTEEFRTIFQFTISEDYHPIFQTILQVLNTLLSYIGKILYPRTFSFLSVPKVIILPAIYMSWKALRQKKYDLKMMLAIFFFTYLVVYLARASHGRYLLPIVPVIAVFFVSFINYPFKNKVELIKVLIVTFIFMSFGFFFEMSYVFYKIIIELFLFILIVLSVLKPFGLSKYFYSFLQKITLIFCIVVMFGASMLFYFTQGQMKNYILFGRNREIEKIVEMIPEKEKVWINNVESYDYMSVLIGQTYSWPEWKWDLAPFVPKKRLLKAYGEQYIYNDRVPGIPAFKEYLLENEIRYIIFIESELESEPWDYEEFFQDFKQEPWLVEEKVENLKNKKVYLFKVDL